ncbi:MAG: putative Mg2+ transporter-C (MgtC) family protein [Patescibacteria group bacterium]|nr:putative Mg2+ transporter-C (MgtC) family protein [Patescibacteria group bacterium]
MINFFDAQTVDIIIRLGMALVFGMFIGTERILAHKTAGMRTYALVAMGSALFIIVSIIVTSSFSDTTVFDPMRMAAQIVSAAGFICAGLVFVRKDGITGLTSSAGLWVSVGIGMACGFGLFKLALIGTIFTLFIFIVLWFVEASFKKSRFFRQIDNQKD